MSDESAPKFRLKVKTASEPAPVAPATEAGTPVPDSPAVPVANQPKFIRLKPRLAEAVVQEGAPVVVPEPRSVVADFPPPFPPEPTPPPEPVVPEAPAAEKQEMKFKLRRRGSEPEPAAESAAPDPSVSGAAASTFPFPHDGPVPAPVIQDAEEGGSPAAITSIRNVTAMPFPPRAGNFPPPPSAARPPPPWAQVPAPAVSGKRNLFIRGGAVVVSLAVLVGAYFAYSKFTAEPPPPPPKAALPVKPAAPVVPSAVEPVAHEAATVAQSTPETPAATVVPAIVVVAPPAKPSPAFVAWVEHLKIGGVRTGKATRIFIGGTAYATGELVNLPLAITFESYDPETRLLTFRDKSGAKVDRRN